MSLKVDKVQLDIILKADEARKELVGLETEVVDLTKDLANLKKANKENTQEFIDKSKHLDEARARMAELQKQIGLTGMTMGELTKRQRELTAQMRNLDPRSPEFAKLRAELDAVNARMRELRGGAQQTQTQLQGMGSKLKDLFTPQMLGISALAGAIYKIGESFTETFKSIQATGDKWAITVEGMTSGWEYFKRSLITADFSNFFTNMDKAIKAGREYAEIMDRLGDEQRQFEIMESEAGILIAQWEIELKNINLTNEERIAIADKIIAKEEELHKRKKEMAQEEFDATSKAVAAKAGMDEKELQSLIRNYRENEKLSEQAKQYLELSEDINILRLRTGFGDLETADKLDAERKTMTDSNKSLASYAKVYKGYLKTTDDELKKISSSWAALNNVTKDYYLNISNAANRKNKLLAKEEKDGAKVTKDAYQEDINALEIKIREERILLVQAHLTGKKTEKEYNEEILALDKKLVEGKITIAKKHNRDSSVERQKQAEDELRNRERRYNEALAALDKQHQTAQLKLLQSRINGEITDKQYNSKLLIAENVFQQLKIDIMLKAGKNVAVIQKKIFDDQLKQLQEADKKLDDMLDAAVGEQIDERMQLEERSRQFKANSLALQRDTELFALKKMHDEQLLSDAEYADASLKIWASYIADKIAYAQQFVNMASATFDAYSEAQFAKLEAEKEKELALAGSDADRREKIEQEYAQKELDLKKKQADTKFAVQIAEITSSTALAIATTYGQLGLIGGSIAAPILAAMGVFQAQAAKAERDKVKAMTLDSSSSGSTMPTARRVVIPAGTQAPVGGFASGGYTGDGGMYQPAGVVHKGEYVIPNRLLRQPKVLNYARIIDNIRLQHTSSNPLPGYAAGGFVSAPPAPAASPNEAALIAALEKNNRLWEQLLNSPIQAYISYNDLKDSETRVTDGQSRASRAT